MGRRCLRAALGFCMESRPSIAYVAVRNPATRLGRRTRRGSKRWIGNNGMSVTAGRSWCGRARQTSSSYRRSRIFGRDVPLTWHAGKAATRSGWPNEAGRSQAVDFSPVGLAKAQRLAESRQVDVRWVESAVEEWNAPPDGFDLVAVFYLQLPQPQRSVALTVAAASVAPGGTLLVVAHDHDNLTRGFGGPQDDAVLYSVSDVADRGRSRAASSSSGRAGDPPRRPPNPEGARPSTPWCGPVGRREDGRVTW